MKQVLEVFFDYACPYCLRAHEHLASLYGQYPQLEVVWRPCEAHPRPERYGPHSDLLIRGMFFAQEHGADLWAYHSRMYRAALQHRVNVEDIDVVADVASSLLDKDKLANSLRRGDYVDTLKRANHYAYEQSGVWVVPAYRLNGKQLDAVEDIGVTKEQLTEFINKGLC